MTKQEIADLIRAEYDPKPSHWKANEKGWDDGADAIAEAIHAEIEYFRKGLRMIADAAKDKASSVWVQSRAEALLAGEHFIDFEVV